MYAKVQRFRFTPFPPERDAGLWTSVVLSGVSGGVYALITAHLGTVIMNHREMSQPWVRVGVVTITAATDVGVYVYQVQSYIS